METTTRNANNLYLFGEITEEKVLELIKQIHTLQKPALLYINSEGGSLYDAFALYHAIRHSPKKITTIGFGLVASAAVIILAAGHKKLISAEGWVMVHEGQSDYGTATPKEIRKTQMQSIRLEKQYCDILATHSKADTEIWDKLCKKETYLTANELMDLGLVDQVIKGK